MARTFDGTVEAYVAPIAKTVKVPCQPTSTIKYFVST